MRVKYFFQRAILLALIVGAIPASWLRADIKLPKIFSDHMVLQRDETVSIWGTADPGESLSIRLGDQAGAAVADGEGRWQAEIKPPIGPGPFTLEIQGATTRVVLEDVLIGEVWICAGQLNMRQPLNELPADEQADVESAIPELRLFDIREHGVDHPLSDLNETSGWLEAGKPGTAECSAVGYHFGRALQQELRVPVGVIVAANREGVCESWIPWQALQESGEFQELLTEWESKANDRLNRNRPGNSFNAMIAPITALRVRGVCWYQGESDVGRSEVYCRALPQLIQCWRQRFRGRRIPFLVVQPAPYRYRDHAAEELPKIWNCQRRVLQLEGTAVVATGDLARGETPDQVRTPVVGQRLARLALARSYDRTEIEASGPVVRQCQRDGSRVLITFDYAAGLRSTQIDEVPGFLIAGGDQQFVPAQATLDGDGLIVWSDAVAAPVKVRYGWSDTFQPSLFNAAGLPAIPFECDVAQPVAADSSR